MRPVVLALTALSLLAPEAASAQALRGAGFFGGATESRQLRPRAKNSDRRNGVVVGAWIDVPLPSGGWSVLAEAGVAQRGGTYPVGEGFTGQVESDVLEATLAPSRHLDVGFVGAYVYGGPTVEVPVRTRTSVDLEPAFRNPAGQVFSVTAGGGVELRIPDTYSFRLEIRHVEGVSAAYTGDQGDFRHRATEILVRVGRSRP